MAKTSNVFEEAIAEAKQIRKTAIENAKQALEESMTPKLQRMISQRLQEMEGDEGINENEDLEETVDLNLDEVEDEDVDVSDDDSASTEETEPADDPKISSLTVSELTQIIQDIVAQGAHGEEEHTDMDMEMSDDLGDTEEMSMDSTEEPTDEEEIDLDELMSGLDSLNEEDDAELEEAKVKGTSQQKGGTYKVTPGFKKVGVGSMHESKKVKALQKELNEVNLLNSKLLYVNKIFKTNQLNENQKLRVIEKFENLTNVKSVKLMFESLNKSLTKSKPTNLRKQIKENLGFASKSIVTGTAKRTQIVEDSSITRMKKLAGIK